METPKLPVIAPKQEVKLPTILELFEDNEDVGKIEGLNAILSVPPPAKWIKAHPFIKGGKDEQGNDLPYLYIPIDKVEHLLRKIFKSYQIEITGQGTAFNGVWVTVRVHYLNPATGEMSFHDGIGACQLQTKKGTSPSDLININNGAISMAFPIAKTVAIKDACDHFGNIFGCNLNRKDVVNFTPDETILSKIKTNKEKLNGN